MSKLGDGRTSDLIRRFESLALEKGSPPKPSPKRTPASDARMQRREDSADGVRPGAQPATPLTIAAAQSALSAAIAHADSPASDAKTDVSRVRASSDVSAAEASIQQVSGQRQAEPQTHTGRSLANTIDLTASRTGISPSSANTDSSVSRRESKSLLSVLNKRASIDPTLQVSQNSWLAFAERCIDEARVSQDTGDAETAYVRYMMACNIFSKKFRKLREGSAVLSEPAYVKLRKDISSWVVDELERLHKQLEHRPYVEAEHQRDSQPMTSEQLDRLESRFSEMYPENPLGISQAGGAKASPQGNSHPSDAVQAPQISSGDNGLAERQNRFDEIDAQVRQNDASMQTLQYFDPSATTCTAQELWALLEQSRTGVGGRPRVLLLDVRAHAEFVWGRIDHRHVVNVDPLALHAKCSTADIERSLVLVSEEQQAWFRTRDEFDLVVYVSQAMHSFSDAASHERAPLEHLNSAVYHYECRRPLRRPPLFLIGGFDAWVKEVGSERCLWSEGARRANAFSRPQALQPQASQSQVSQNQASQSQVSQHPVSQTQTPQSYASQPQPQPP
ncbi:ubiquitin-specific protease doa4, partial [Coemansia sp. RSA 2618]